MVRTVHPIVGAVALMTIATFWLSTVISELFGAHALVTTVKTTLPWGFLILIPALAAAGGSGLSLAGGSKIGLAGAKAKRMPFIAGNGILILIPSALYLASKARAGEFDCLFYAVQALELIAGATNLSLLGLNMRDGLKLSGRLGRADSHDVRLISREVLVKGVVSLRFTKPDGFSHVAGQHVTLSLPDSAGADAKRWSRTLTLASAPGEKDLMIATRLSESSFKLALGAMPAGAVARVTAARGDMTLHADPARPAVFLAGGIGITPLLAMARDAANRALPHRITLFYSNRRTEDAAFLDDLRSLEMANPKFRLIATMTEATPSWSGEKGHVTEDMLRRHVTDLRAPIYYLAGPPAMTRAMRDVLSKAGVANADVRSEEFFGC